MGVGFDKNNRTVIFHCDVNADNIAELNRYLLDLIHDDDKKSAELVGFERQPIHLHINSNGGNVNDMWSAISIIRTTETPIYTYCEGYAYSAGFTLFISGDKRVMYEGAELIYHSLSCDMWGKYQDLTERMDNLHRVNQKLEQYTLNRTSLTKEILNDIKEKKQDLYIYDDKALDLGCADEIVHFV